MQNTLAQVIADPAFQKHATAMGGAIPAGEVQSLDAAFEQVRRFASVRRREVRISLLREAGRAGASDWQSHRERVPEAVSAIGAAVKILSDRAHACKSLISPQLDDVIALASAADHPLQKMILETGLSLGFTPEELDWLFGELAAIKYRPVQLLCADGFQDLTALLAGISVGEGGLLLAGFVRFTDDPEIDTRLEKIVIRLREQGVTASVFLALVIVITAHAVAAVRPSSPR
jgi:hypothetical protein